MLVQTQWRNNQENVGNVQGDIKSSAIISKFHKLFLYKSILYNFKYYKTYFICLMVKIKFFKPRSQAVKLQATYCIYRIGSKERPGAYSTKSQDPRRLFETGTYSKPALICALNKYSQIHIFSINLKQCFMNKMFCNTCETYG